MTDSATLDAPPSAGSTFLTPDEVAARLPFRVADRRLRRLLRQSGLCIGNGWQIRLPAENWSKFLETFKPCSASSSAGSSLRAAKTRGPGKSRARARTQVSPLALARELATRR